VLRRPQDRSPDSRPCSDIPPSTPKRRCRRKPSIPNELRADVTQHVRTIAKKYRSLFIADRELKDRVLRLERALLPPRPRPRGRPRNPTVTRAITLYRKLRRQSPEENPQAIWRRVYPLVIPEYETMPELEQRTAREDLYERVRWRLRIRRRKIRIKISTTTTMTAADFSAAGSQPVHSQGTT
jgi:hypothetical protein